MRNADRLVRAEWPRSRDAEAETRKGVSVHAFVAVWLLLLMRLHDCWQSFASRALALGQSLLMIGRLLGHSQVQTTTRYAHLARDSVHDATLRVPDRIEVYLYRNCPGPAAVEG